MRDTLETAQHFGLVSQVSRLSQAVDLASFDRLLAEWIDLTVALNALNRSMGVPDPYPFQITNLPGKKLAFVHEVVQSAAAAAFSACTSTATLRRWAPPPSTTPRKGLDVAEVAAPGDA